MESEKCDFGVYLEDCHKLHHIRKPGIKLFSNIDSETGDVLLWRSGVRDKIIDSICFHHEAKFGSVFEKRFNKCCDKV